MLAVVRDDLLQSYVFHTCSYIPRYNKHSEACKILPDGRYRVKEIESRSVKKLFLSTKFIRSFFFNLFGRVMQGKMACSSTILVYEVDVVSGCVWFICLSDLSPCSSFFCMNHLFRFWTVSLTSYYIFCAALQKLSKQKNNSTEWRSVRCNLCSLTKLMFLAKTLMMEGKIVQKIQKMQFTSPVIW